MLDRLNLLLSLCAIVCTTRFSLASPTPLNATLGVAATVIQPKFYEDCQNVINQLPSDRSRGQALYSFDEGAASGRYRLPVNVRAGSCEVYIHLHPRVDRDLCNWTTIVRTLNEMNEFCLNQGITEKYDVIGLGHRIIVTLYPPSFGSEQNSTLRTNIASS